MIFKFENNSRRDEKIGGALQARNVTSIFEIPTQKWAKFGNQNKNL